MSRGLNAIALSAIMIASLFAVSAVALPGTAQEETTAPTEITSCTVIDSPGHYALTQDIVRPEGDEGPCLEIRASDVTLEGNGHVIDGNDSDTGSDEVGIATTAAHPVRNVTVANVTVRENRDSIRLKAVTDGQLTNVTSEDPAVSGVVVRQSERIEIRDSDLHSSSVGNGLTVDNSENLNVVNNTLSGGNGFSASGVNRSEISGNVVSGLERAISLRSGSENTISNNTIPRGSHQAITVRGTNNTVIGNTVTLADDGIELSGSNHTVANNDVDRIIGWAASAEGTNHTFVNNRFRGGEPAGASGGALRVSGSGYVIENNSLTGFHGVYVASATGPISLRHNSLSGVKRLVVAESKLCPDPGVIVTAHENVFERPELTNYRPQYGIQNHDDDMVNATNNYWGTESGPSSHDWEAVTDPVTGEPADGTGMAVSEGVHFDPYLERPPANMTES